MGSGEVLSVWLLNFCAATFEQILEQASCRAMISAGHEEELADAPRASRSRSPNLPICAIGAPSSPAQQKATAVSRQRMSNKLMWRWKQQSHTLVGWAVTCGGLHRTKVK